MKQNTTKLCELNHKKNNKYNNNNNPKTKTKRDENQIQWKNNENQKIKQGLELFHIFIYVLDAIVFVPFAPLASALSASFHFGPGKMHTKPSSRIRTAERGNTNPIGTREFNKSKSEIDFVNTPVVVARANGWKLAYLLL